MEVVSFLARFNQSLPPGEGCGVMVLRSRCKTGGLTIRATSGYRYLWQLSILVSVQAIIGAFSTSFADDSMTYLVHRPFLMLHDECWTR